MVPLTAGIVSETWTEVWYWLIFPDAKGKKKLELKKGVHYLAKEDEVYGKLLQQKESGLLLGVSGELDTIVAAHEAREHNQQAQQHKASSYEELMKQCGTCMQIEGRDNFAVDKRVNEHTEGWERGLATKTTAHVVIEYEEGGGIEIIADRSEDAEEDMQTAEFFSAQWKEGYFRN
jgi:hypothetical protein